jgi:hypothetical protein
MPIQNAINFIKNASIDPKLRSFLNNQSSHDIPDIMQQLGYNFTAFEFEESINILHVKCQFEEQANQLHEIVTWFRLLTS